MRDFSGRALCTYREGNIFFGLYFIAAATIIAFRAFLMAIHALIVCMRKSGIIYCRDFVFGAVELENSRLTGSGENELSILCRYLYFPLAGLRYYVTDAAEVRRLVVFLSVHSNKLRASFSGRFVSDKATMSVSFLSVVDYYLILFSDASSGDFNRFRFEVDDVWDNSGDKMIFYTMSPLYCRRRQFDAEYISADKLF